MPVHIKLIIGFRLDMANLVTIRLFQLKQDSSIITCSLRKMYFGVQIVVMFKSNIITKFAAYMD